MLDVIACIWHLVLIWSFSSSIKTFLDIHISHTPYTIECLKIPNFFYINCREVHWAPKTPNIHYTFPPSLIFKLTIIHFYFSYIVKSKNRSPSYKIGHNSVHSRQIWLKLSGVTPETCFAMTLTWRMGAFLIGSEKFECGESFCPKKC